MGDINNAFETLERSLKKIGIVLIDEQEDIKNGKSSQIIALVRKILISTSTVVAKQMLLKGCPSHATDKKLAIAAFDVLRDSKQAPNISIDQFFSQGFVHHKLTILSRLADYVSNTSKSPRPTVMSAFVTEPDIIATSVFSKYYSSSPPKSYVQVDSSESDWPLSDFIRQHIIDNKVNTDAMTRKEFKKTILRSRSAASVAAAVAEENRSRANSRNSRSDSPSQLGSTTTRPNNTIRQQYQSGSGDFIANTSRFSPVGSNYSDGEDEEVHEEVDDEYLNHQIAVDYAYELSRQSPTGSHKANIRAVQAQEAEMRRNAQPVNNKQPSPVQQQQQQAAPTSVKINTPRAKYSYASNSSNIDSFDSALDDLTIATNDVRASRASGSGSGKSSGNKPAVGFGSSSVKEVGRSHQQVQLQSATKKSLAAPPSPAVEKISQQQQPTEDQRLQQVQQQQQQKEQKEREQLEREQTFEAQMTDRIEAEVQKRLDARLSDLVDQRVADAVLEVTQKYDFIINKLVAAVDAEFTLLNNQLRLAGGASSPGRQQQQQQK